MKKIVAFAIPMLVPALALAQVDTSFLKTSIANLTDVVNSVVGLLLAVEVVVFIWGVIKGVLAGGDPGKASEAKKYLIWSIVAITVTLAVWGLAHLLIRIFGVNQYGNSLNSGDIPKVTPLR